MPRPLMETPMTLESLGSDHAVFSGSAEQTHIHETVFGSAQMSMRYPSLAIQREVWESLECPTRFLLVVTELP